MLKKILTEFLLIDGVSAAAVIGHDGFVIEIAQKSQSSDIDALGALCSSSIRLLEQSGELLDMGPLRQIILEYREGGIILVPVSPEEFLAIFIDTLAGLGSLTYTIARTSSRVAAII